MLHQLLKTARKEAGLKARDVAQYLGIDQALVSKFESGDRIPTEEQLQKLAGCLQIPFEKLAVEWLRRKITREIGLHYREYAVSAMNMVMEDFIGYGKKAAYSSNLQEVLKQIDENKRRLDALRHLDNYRIAQALELEYTFESNRIEGNTLTLRETDLVVNEGLTVSGKSLREHLEAINHKDAIVYMKELVSEDLFITEREIKELHNLILRGIHPEEAGRYRKVPVMIKGSAHLPPEPVSVNSHMEDFFRWLYRNASEMHPVLFAAEAHERLVTIHPFIDGNGRTARLLMNLILLRHGYVIANIKGDSVSRLNYYEALEAVQTNRSKEAFLLFVAKVELESLQRYLSIIDVQQA